MSVSILSLPSFTMFNLKSKTVTSIVLMPDRELRQFQMDLMQSTDSDVLSQYFLTKDKDTWLPYLNIEPEVMCFCEAVLRDREAKFGSMNISYVDATTRVLGRLKSHLDRLQRDKDYADEWVCPTIEEMNPNNHAPAGTLLRRFVGARDIVHEVIADGCGGSYTKDTGLTTTEYEKR